MTKYMISFLACCLLLLSSCGREVVSSKAPVYDLTVTDAYVVKTGDSLYSIAWLYNLDYMKLAKINNIKAPYSVVVGQHITLYDAPTIAAEPKATKSVTRKYTKSTKAKKIVWQWPIASRASRASAILGATRGIDIAAKYGENVYAAAAGTVVYNGSGIKGYGNLVIIKHSDSVLTAYGYSSKSFVKENQKVRKGQKIALVGKDLNGKAKLHFEIRENGKSVNPIKLLPAQRRKHS